MKKSKFKIITFLKDLMRRRNLSQSQLARDLSVSHATITRWLSGEDVPSPRSCRKIAEYSNVHIQKIFSYANHFPQIAYDDTLLLPEFSEYARAKYPKELDEDTIIMIEDLIERRREKNRSRKSA